MGRALQAARRKGNAGQKFKKSEIREKTSLDRLTISIPRPKGVPPDAGIVRREACMPGRRLLDDFVVEQVVLLFAGFAHAAYCAADQKGNAQRYQNGWQIAAQTRQVEQNLMHLRDPHKLHPLVRRLNPS